MDGRCFGLCERSMERYGFFHDLALSVNKFNKNMRLYETYGFIWRIWSPTKWSRFSCNVIFQANFSVVQSIIRVVPVLLILRTNIKMKNIEEPNGTHFIRHWFQKPFSPLRIFSVSCGSVSQKQGSSQFHLTIQFIYSIQMFTWARCKYLWAECYLTFRNFCLFISWFCLLLPMD